MRAAQRAADGLLLTAHARARRRAPRRAGARTRRESVSRRDCTLEPRTGDAGPVGLPAARLARGPVDARGAGRVCGTCAASPTRLLDRIDDERAAAPFTDLEDFTRRTGAPVDALEALATAGAFGSLDVDAARRALGRGRVARRRGRSSTGAWTSAPLPGVVTGVEAPALPGMTEVEETAADLWAIGLSPGRHPTEFVRAQLDGARGA